MSRKLSTKRALWLVMIALAVQSGSSLAQSEEEKAKKTLEYYKRLFSDISQLKNAKPPVETPSSATPPIEFKESTPEPAPEKAAPKKLSSIDLSPEVTSAARSVMDSYINESISTRSLSYLHSSIPYQRSKIAELRDTLQKADAFNNLDASQKVALKNASKSIPVGDYMRLSESDKKKHQYVEAEERFYKDLSYDLSQLSGYSTANTKEPGKHGERAILHEIEEREKLGWTIPKIDLSNVNSYKQGHFYQDTQLSGGFNNPNTEIYFQYFPLGPANYTSDFQAHVKHAHNTMDKYGFSSTKERDNNVKLDSPSAKEELLKDAQAGFSSTTNRGQDTYFPHLFIIEGCHVFSNSKNGNKDPLEFGITWKKDEDKQWRIDKLGLHVGPGYNMTKNSMIGGRRYMPTMHFGEKTIDARNPIDNGYYSRAYTSRNIENGRMSTDFDVEGDKLIYKHEAFEGWEISPSGSKTPKFSAPVAGQPLSPRSHFGSTSDSSSVTFPNFRSTAMPWSTRIVNKGRPLMDLGQSGPTVANGMRYGMFRPMAGAADSGTFTHCSSSIVRHNSEEGSSGCTRLDYSYSKYVSDQIREFYKKEYKKLIPQVREEFVGKIVKHFEAEGQALSKGSAELLADKFILEKMKPNKGQSPENEYLENAEKFMTDGQLSDSEIDKMVDSFLNPEKVINVYHGEYNSTKQSAIRTYFENLLAHRVGLEARKSIAIRTFAPLNSDDMVTYLEQYTKRIVQYSAIVYENGYMPYPATNGYPEDKLTIQEYNPQVDRGKFHPNGRGRKGPVELALYISDLITRGKIPAEVFEDIPPHKGSPVLNFRSRIAKFQNGTSGASSGALAEFHKQKAEEAYQQMREYEKVADTARRTKESFGTFKFGLRKPYKEEQLHYESLARQAKQRAESHQRSAAQATNDKSFSVSSADKNELFLYLYDNLDDYVAAGGPINWSGPYEYKKEKDRVDAKNARIDAQNRNRQKSSNGQIVAMLSRVPEPHQDTVPGYSMAGEVLDHLSVLSETIRNYKQGLGMNEESLTRAVKDPITGEKSQSREDYDMLARNKAGFYAAFRDKLEDIYKDSQGRSVSDPQSNLQNACKAHFELVSAIASPSRRYAAEDADKSH